ncbi:MAG TPA: response regulator transcription factor [Firmicutes bacterium]|jgi:two-component system OmpR family response regulator|nr:response regulator transcription factor [Bacillota bacterium]
MHLSGCPKESNPYRVFVAEDDPKMARLICEHLEKYGYCASRAVRFDDLKSEFLNLLPHLVLLDVNLPYMDGFYWCRQIRTVSNVPIIFISARTDDPDQIRAIENGGDDYITKPFNVEVMIAKIRSALRRAYGEYSVQQTGFADVLELTGLYLHRSKCVIEYAGKRAVLTPNEMRLFELMVSKAESVVSREELLEALWDDVDFVDDNTLSVNVARLRKKLEKLGIPDAISTVRGHGYRLTATWTKTRLEPKDALGKPPC